MNITQKQLRACFLLLRLGVAFVFIYAVVAAHLRPDDWIGYFPSFLLNTFPHTLLLTGWGIFELILGIWFLTGRYLFIPSILASLAMLGVIIFNWNGMDVVFRDVSILATTIGLAVVSFKEKRV